MEQERIMAGGNPGDIGVSSELLDQTNEVPDAGQVLDTLDRALAIAHDAQVRLSTGKTRWGTEIKPCVC